MYARIRITVTMALIIGLAVVPLTAGAKKGKPAPQPPAEVLVTIEMAGDGLATTCTGPLTMNRANATMLRLDWAPSGEGFGAHVPIAWTRSHPVATAGDALTGCHGGPLAGSGDGFFGYLILTGDGDGVALSSRFDYFWEYGLKGKRTVQTVLEFLEIGATLTRVDGQPFDWSAGGVPQTVTGELELRRFEKLADRSGVGWQTFGSIPVEMTITIEPAS
jgi:hypothetical protein